MLPSPLKTSQCIVPKSCRLGAAKRTPQEHNKIYGARDATKLTLTDKSIRYAIRQIEKGRGTKVVAEELKISQ